MTIQPGAVSAAAATEKDSIEPFHPDRKNKTPSDAAASSTTEADPSPDAVLAQIPSMVRDPATGREVFKPTRAFFLAYGALAVLTLVVALDATTLSVALPQMSTELHGTALEAFWSGTSFLLASCVLQPSIAAMSAIFGRKYAIYASSLFFLAGSVVAALAGNFTIVLVGRTLQGIGGGGIIALTEVVITDLVPLSVRGQWFSGLSAMWSVGTVAGPLIGAGFAQNVTWRWIFWINVPIIVAGVVLIFFFLNQSKLPGGLVAKLGRFDWTGSVLFTAGSTVLLFGITVGGVMYEWDSYGTLLPLLLGVAAVVAFAFWELRFAENPMIDKGIFNNWDMISSYVQSVLHGAIVWSLLYFLILYYQGVKLMDSVGSALAVLPETLTVAPAAMIVGIVVARTGHYRWSMWIGWVLTTLGTGLLYLLAPDSTTGQWVGLNIPVGIGTGMLFPAMALSVQAACRPALNAQAAAFFSFLRVFGQAIGVAVSGVIFQNAFRTELAAIPAFVSVADEYSRDATAVVYIIRDMDDPEARAVLIGAYNEALRVVWFALLGFSGLSMFFGFTLRGYSLDQEHVTEQGLVETGRKKAPDPESGRDKV